jgi:hypothetical protein
MAGVMVIALAMVSVSRLIAPTIVVQAPVVVRPAHQSIKAIDSANTITDPNWFHQVYDAGFRLYIMHATAWGTCNPWEHTVPQLKMALDAGLKIAIYTRDPRCWQGGIEAVGAYRDQLQFFALDIEVDHGIPVTRAMVDGVKAMGVRPVIYTGHGMWDDLHKGNDDEFKDVPLWDADTSKFAYDSWKADYLSPQPVAYGGWNTADTMRIGVQQQFEYNLFNTYVDLNSFDATFLK